MPKGSTTKRERAIVRQDGESDIAFLERKLAHAKQVEADKAAAKVARVEKRISAIQSARADLDRKLAELQAERDRLVGVVTTEPPAESA